MQTREAVVPTEERQLRLTEAQKQLWLLAELDANASVAYNVRYAVELLGETVAAAMRHALQAVVDRHDLLRARVDPGGDTLTIAPAVDAALSLEDLSDLAESAQRERLCAEVSRPFNLGAAPLFRATLYRTGPGAHVLLLVSHHLVVDGASMQTILRELGELYSASCAGLDARLPAPPSYAEHVESEDRLRATPGWLADQEYWIGRFREPASPVDLPADHLRPAMRTFNGAIESCTIAPDVAGALEQASRTHGCTLFMVLFAAFATLLRRLTGQDDLVIGINVSGRSGKRSDRLVGYLTRLLPVRLRVTPDARVPALLDDVRETLLAALEHRRFTLGDLVQALNLPRQPGRSPIVDVVFNFDRDAERFEFAGLGARLVLVPLTTAKFDVDFNVIETRHGLLCEVEYRTDLFRPETVRRFLHLWQNLVTAFAARADGRIGELPWLDEQERRRMLLEWNRTEQERPWVSLLDLLEESARRTPTSTAVAYEGVTLTYRELMQRANRLGRYLSRAGVGREVRVGVCLDRGLDWVVTILAIWKARGVYVPIDVTYPRERRAFMLRDAAVDVLVTEEALSAELPAHAARVVCLDAEWQPIDDESAEDPGTRIWPEDLAYVMYTSGSTGAPKGAMVEHGGMMNHLWSKVEDLHLSPRDVVVQNAPASFDVSVWQIFAALLAGGQVQIVGEELARDGRQLLAEVHRLGATVVETVPTLLGVMVADQQDGARQQPLDLPHLRFLISNAEALPIRLCQQWMSLYPQVTLFNAYGPTECSDDVTHLVLQEPFGSPKYAPLGRPIRNMQVYVLDDAMEPVPIGVAGEVYIGGVGVGRGYRERPELTAERFVPDPFGTRAGGRLYRTGDQVRLLPDGTCDFIGRFDYQVKLRGLRIELAEIEVLLLQHPAVLHAAVIVREDDPGDQRLVGYVVAKPGAPADVPALRAYLKERLPDYMVPGAIVPLERMPLTTSEKVDRRALPRPHEDRGGRQRPYRAPRDRVEEMMAQIWSDVLRVARVGIDDNFFELGGHSLLATQVVSRLRKLLQVELPLRRLFEAPTVAALARAVEEHRAAGSRKTFGPIARVAQDRPIPLSYAQQRLWFVQQYETEQALYNMPTVMRVTGRLDLPVLERTLDEVVRRHESLRTRFVEGDEEGTPVQIVDPPFPVRPAVVDLQPHTDEERQTEMARLIDAEVRRPFDLRRGPLFRALLLKLAPEEHVCVLNMHHIVSDGWSMEVLLHELITLYDAYARGEASPLPELPIQYRDYTVWQHASLEGDVLQAELEYWKKQLAGMPEAIELPTKGPRPAVPSYRGRQHAFALSKDLSTALQELSGQYGVTIFITLLAAFQALLARYCRQTDIVVGSPVAGRTRSDIEGLVGFFLNILVLRADLSGRPSFAELVRRVREVALGAYANQDLPFERLVEELHPHRMVGRTPLYQVLFNLQRPTRLEGAGLVLSEQPFEFPLEKFDLSFGVIDAPEGLRGIIRYQTDLFDDETIAAFARHYEMLLAGVVAAPDRPIDELELLTPPERQLMLEGWNATERAYDDRACVHALFEEQVRQRPHAIAVAHAGRQVTYAQLDRRAEHVARQLRALGVGPEARVGICAPRNVGMVAGLLGILKAGAAYVPLDPEYPKNRLQFMLEDAGARVVLTERQLRESLPAHEAVQVYLDAEEESLESPADAAETSLKSDNAAYVIYTSGSTGRPKGITVEHRSVVAMLHWAHDAFAACGLEGVLASTSICFDLSVFELFVPLTCGGTAILADNALELPRLAERDSVTLINTVPTAAAELLRMNALPHGVRTVNLAGEALKRPLVDELHQATGVESVFNLYGPTEDTVYSTHALVPRHGQDVLIGRPISNTQAYVLDEAGDPVPAGVAGELCLGGAGLARGYANRPDLTADRFVPNPFSARGERLYRTGDRARWRHSGELEYLGRLDHQVKIHGFRIEVAEVETALLRLPGVKEAVVVPREIEGETRLVAYVVPIDAPLATGALREALAVTLPRPMLPWKIVTLDRLPLTANGKVDRKALPLALEQEAGASSSAPRTDLERHLCRIWADALRREEVGIDRDFFELGGHSLLAMRVISRVRSELHVELTLRALFESPTLAGFAARVASALATAARPASIVAVTRTPDLPLSYAQSRLWFIHQLQPRSVAYNAPLDLRLTGELDQERLEACLTEIVRRHEVLRTTFPARAGQPVQEIHPPYPVQAPIIDLSALDEHERGELARGLRDDEAVRLFDLARGPLLRVRLLRLGPQEHELLLSMHHIVSDGWSRAVLMRELLSLWQADADRRSAAVPALAIQYADYALWQQGWLEKEVLDQQLPYWRRQLRDLPVLDLPTDHPRRGTTSHVGAEVRFSFTAEERDALMQWSRREGATPFMVLLAGFAWLLRGYSGQEDITVGTVIANRNRKELEDLVGLFVNTLVLRTDVSGSPTFAELVRRVREVTLGAYAHQDVPFEKLVEELNPERDLGRSPLFQVRFTLDAEPVPLPAAGGLAVEEIYLELPEVKFDLTMALEDGSDGTLSGSLVYAGDLFERGTIERMVRQYRRLLAVAVAEPGVSLAALPVLPDEEREQVLTAWNRTSIEREPGRCVHDLFEQWVRLTPDAPALVHDGVRLDYRELNRRSNQVAHLLRDFGVGPEVRVGLCMTRSLDMVVALLGVLKSGGTYVPIDPATPPERIALVFEDANVPIVLTQERLRQQLPAQWIHVLCLDADWPAFEVHSADDPPPMASPDNLAYVIYTSGSTGTPKGVAIEHRQLVNYVDAVTRAMGCEPGWRFAFVSNVAADLGNTGLFASLCGGGELHVIGDRMARDGRQLAAYVRSERIDCMKITPSHLEALQPAADVLPSRLLVLGGESSSWRAVEDLRAQRPGCRIMNHYGPTECTVGALVCPLEDVPRRGSEHVPLGRPLDNVQVYVLGDAGQPLPVGTIGELAIGGAGVGRGYLHAPAITAGRFVPDPFSNEAGARLYLTGDRARWLPDGTVEFLGRVDHQVKIRGFRVELEEIESTLKQHPDVQQAAVVVREEQPGQPPRLVAYASRRAAAAGADEAPLEYYDLPNGLTIAHQNRDETEFLYQQIYEEGFYLQHSITIPEDACIFDVGANIGMFTLFASEHCSRGRILAFEPIDALCRTLRHNAELCAADVSVFPIGIAEVEGTAEFAFYPEYSLQTGMTAYTVPEMESFRTDTQVCRLRRLSDIIREEDIDYIDLLKVDVQRSEMDVLHGLDEGDWEKIAQVALFVIRHSSTEATERRVREVVSLLEGHGLAVSSSQDGELKGGDWSIFARNARVLERRPARPVSGTRKSAGSVTDDPELRRYLQERLPDYMVPSSVLVMPWLPLTTSGKLDRRALPIFEERIAPTRSYVPPATELEALICRVWSEVLGVTPVGLHDNFFDLGGHSLLATQVVSRLEGALDLEVSLATIFRAPVVADLADALEQVRIQTEPPAVQLVPLNREAFASRS